MTFSELKQIHETKKTLDELETARKENAELKREIENLNVELTKVKKQKASYLSQIVDMQCCGNCVRNVDDSCKGAANCDWIFFKS